MTPTPSEARQVAAFSTAYPGSMFADAEGLYISRDDAASLAGALLETIATLRRQLEDADAALAERDEAIRALRQGGEVDDEARRKARCWDDLLAARDAARKAPDDSEWKRLARSGETMAAIKACRAAHGFSLTEARDCVEIYALPPPPAEGEAA